MGTVGLGHGVVVAHGDDEVVCCYCCLLSKKFRLHSFLRIHRGQILFLS